MPPMYTHTHDYDLLKQFLSNPGNAEGLILPLMNLVSKWLEEVLPGQFASLFDELSLLIKVLPMVIESCHQRNQAVGGFGAVAGYQAQEYEQEFPAAWGLGRGDEDYVPGYPQDGTGTRDGRVREVIDRATRTGVDTASLETDTAESPSDPEPLQCGAMQNLHIDSTDRGSSSGAPSDRSSLHSRRKPCNSRYAGKYECKIRGCRKYGVPQLYSRLREHIAVHFKRLRTRCPSCSKVYYQPRSCGIHHRNTHRSAMPTPSERDRGTSVAGSDGQEDQEALAAEYIFGHREWVEDP